MMRRTSCLVIALTLLGCAGDSSTDPAVQQITIEAKSSLTVTGIAGTPAPANPEVRVFDKRDGKPLANIPIGFVTTNGGSVEFASILTNADGLASAGEWKLSSQSGSSSIAVLMNGELKFYFSATVQPDVPASLRLVTPTDTIWIAGREVDGFSVIVEDRFGNGVPNVDVALSTTGTGTLPRISAISSANGTASTGKWLLGIGLNSATFTLAGLTSRTVSVLGIDPATVKWYRLDLEKSGPSGIVNARFGMTTFDKCLCKKQEGYFVEEIVWQLSGAPISRGADRYELNGEKLAVPPKFGVNGLVNGENVYLDRPDPNGGFVGTWTYTFDSSIPLR